MQHPEPEETPHRPVVHLHRKTHGEGAFWIGEMVEQTLLETRQVLGDFQNPLEALGLGRRYVHNICVVFGGVQDYNVLGTVAVHP